MVWARLWLFFVLIAEFHNVFRALEIHHLVTFNLSGAFGLKLMNTLLSKDLILALSALVTVEHRKELNRKKLSLTYLTVRKLLNDVNKF